MKMEQTECSEMSAYKIQTPGNYPEENIQQDHESQYSGKCLQVTLECIDEGRNMNSIMLFVVWLEKDRENKKRVGSQ